MVGSRSHGYCGRAPDCRGRLVTIQLVALVILAGGAVVCREAPALAQSSATADTAADGSIEYTYQSSSGIELSPADKISELNAKIMRDPTASENYNDLGVVYAQLEEWDKARDAFMAAVQGNPTEADYHRNLGLVFSKLGQYDLAVSEFEAYRRFDVMGARDTWRLIAKAQSLAGHSDQAREVYQEGLEVLDPQQEVEGLRLVLAWEGLERETDDPAAARQVLERYAPAAQEFIRRATAAVSEEGVPLATAILDRLVAEYVANAELMADSGLALEAAETYAKAYTLNPEQDALLPHIVASYQAAGEDLQARVVAHRARNNYPDKIGTWLATAKVYEHERRYEEAIGAYQQAVQIGPASTELDLAIGNLYLQLGDVESARKYMAQGIDDPNTPPEVLYNYAVSLMKEKKYTAATNPLRRVVQQRPEMSQGWAALAQCLRLSKRYEEAVTAYQRTLALRPEAKHAYNLGVCAKRSNQIGIAIEAYELALELDPGYVEARYNLSLALMDAKRYEDAIASFDKMLEIEADSYRVYYSRGLSAYYLGLYDEALDSYEMALEQKETANLYNNIGLVYDKLGQKKKAQSYYKEAKAVGGGS